MSTINWKKLYQESDSNKASRVESNKSKNTIQEMPQEPCPDNFQLKLPSKCQLVRQVPSQLNSKEGTQLESQRDFQVPIQWQHKFIFQMESSRYKKGFPKDMQIIIPVSPGFGYLNRNSNESTTANKSHMWRKNSKLTCQQWCLK